MAGVYRINIENNYYYGSSGNIQKRIDQHRLALTRGKHENMYIQNTYNKYKNFQVEVISEELTRQEAFQLEQKLINEHIGKKSCMNINPIASQPPVRYGADNPSKNPEVIKKGLATKKKNGTLAPSQDPLVAKKISISKIGKTPSEETKKRCQIVRKCYVQILTM
jgi:group I intron endonuclease